MNFVKKDYKELFKDELQTALANGLISHQENFEQYIENKEDISNFYVMILSVHAEVFEEVYNQMQLIYDSTNIDLASGIDLDTIGEWVGIPRASASRAFVEIIFQLNDALEEDLEVLKGVQCITKNGVGYTTVEDFEIPAGLDEDGNLPKVRVPAYADKTGPEQRIDVGELYRVNYSTADGASLICTNDQPSSGGTNIQTDEEYREYLKHWPQIHQKGNEWAYRNFFRTFEGLDGYSLSGCWDGTGTVKVVIDPSSDYLRNTVYEGLTENKSYIDEETGKEIILQESSTLFDEDVVIMGFSGVEIKVNATANIDIDMVKKYGTDRKEDVKRAIIRATKIFIDGGYRNQTRKDNQGNEERVYYRGLEIGEDFIYHKLAVFLDQEIPELKDIEFEYPFVIDYASGEKREITYVEIADDEKAIAGEVEVNVL